MYFSSSKYLAYSDNEIMLNFLTILFINFWFYLFLFTLNEVHWNILLYHRNAYDDKIDFFFFLKIAELTLNELAHYKINLFISCLFQLKKISKILVQT
jgi:hypothetical protein